MIFPPVSSDTIAARGSRLLHHGEVYYLKGDSYRLRGKPKPESDSPEPGSEGDKIVAL
jgi:hypothetical protein